MKNGIDARGIDYKNYLRFGIILVCLTYFLKVNIAPMLLFIVSFLEGLFTKMLEISISKEFYTLSKKFEYVYIKYL